MGENEQQPLSALAEMQAALAEANRRVLNDDQLQQALETFEKIMSCRSDMYLRLSQRVRTTVRGGMAVFALVGIAMFMLLATLVIQVERAERSTAMLAQHVAEVSNDMGRIKASIRNMQGRMGLFVSVGEQMHVMRDHTNSISTEMTVLDDQMATIKTQVSTINQRLGRITHTMGAMGSAVNGMGYNINEVARPAGMFGFLP